MLATIGRGAAVAKIGRFKASGFFAWLLWLFVHILFLIGFRNRLLVMIQWAWSYVTFDRGARLITEPLKEPLLEVEPPESPTCANLRQTRRSLTEALQRLAARFDGLVAARLGPLELELGHAGEPGERELPRDVIARAEWRLRDGSGRRWIEPGHGPPSCGPGLSSG